MLFLTACSFHFGALVGGDVLNRMEGYMTEALLEGIDNPEKTYDIQSKRFATGMIYAGVSIPLGKCFFIQGHINLGGNHDRSWQVGPEIGIDCNMGKWMMGLFLMYERRYLKSFNVKDRRNPIEAHVLKFSKGSIPVDIGAINIKTTYNMKNNWKIVGKLQIMFSRKKEIKLI